MIESTSITVGVVDDHPIYRDGVASTLQAEPDFVIVGTGLNGGDAVRIARNNNPEILLIDLDMPDGGTALIPQLKQWAPNAKIVLLTVAEDEEHVSAALHAGARGYLLKGISGADLKQVLRSISHGESYVMPELAARLLKQIHSRSNASKPLSGINGLSTREEDILERVANGRTNKEIARELKISEKTVKHYMTTIMQKLQVRNRVEAASLLLQSGRSRKKLQR